MHVDLCVTLCHFPSLCVCPCTPKKTERAIVSMALLSPSIDRVVCTPRPQSSSSGCCVVSYEMNNTLHTHTHKYTHTHKHKHNGTRISTTHVQRRRRR